VPAPRIAVGPDPVPDWVREAVEGGGGEVVGPEAAEGLVWVDPFGAAELDKLLASAPGVRWVQLPWAGVEDFARRGMFADGRVWTSGKGVYAEPVAEHALALGLAGLRDLPERVRATRWGPQSGRSLYDARVTVLGGGGIARVLLGLLAPFRAEVTVVRRHPAPLAGAARVVGLERLHEVLPGAALVVLALALTPETVGVIGARELRLMEEHAWVVNVARGPHVRTADLVTALRQRWIGGAALDVTDPEPLPAGHPLWDLPNCIITPHVANTAEMAVAPLSARIAENVRRFGAGEELRGVVDPDLSY
jgi:phosphoglycerate dehydrogenase-like enzyme